MIKIDIINLILQIQINEKFLKKIDFSEKLINFRNKSKALVC